VLLAHPDKARLHEAVEAVEIDYDPLPAVFTIEESERQQTIVWVRQCHQALSGRKGRCGFRVAACGAHRSGEYCTGAQEQLYIENNGVIAEWSDADGLIIRGSMQCRTMCTRRCCASLICLRKRSA